MATMVLSRAARVARPAAAAVLRLSARSFASGEAYTLPESAKRDFFEKGYAVLPNFLTEEEMKPIEVVYDRFMRREIPVRRRDAVWDRIGGAGRATRNGGAASAMTASFTFVCERRASGSRKRSPDGSIGVQVFVTSPFERWQNRQAFARHRGELRRREQAVSIYLHRVQRTMIAALPAVRVCPSHRLLPRVPLILIPPRPAGPRARLLRHVEHGLDDPL
jgi:hypothetical protein